MGDNNAGRRIVVGVDDSPGARAALGYALREGKLGGTRVEVLGAFARPEFWAGEAIPGWSMGPAIEDIREVVQAQVDRVVAEVRDEVGPECADVAVLTHVVAGNAAAVLLDSARSADLLVVGSRGHGGFASMMLGSVSLHCVLHAPCPVTVVPAAVERALDQIPAQASAAN